MTTEQPQDPSAPAAAEAQAAPAPLTAPAGGAEFVAPADIGLAAGVNANGNLITKVQFHAGSTLLGEDTTAPYTWTWSNVAAGSYSLKATAVYNAGSSVVSELRVSSRASCGSLSTPSEGRAGSRVFVCAGWSTAARSATAGAGAGVRALADCPSANG